MSGTNQQILISVPNANTTLVLGILSIISCICYGLPGLIFALIALWISKYGESKYREQPGIYTLSSYNNLIAGKTCAYIGLFFSSLYLLIILIYLLMFGVGIFTALQMEDILRQLQEMQE